ncbi:MAG: Rieske 2Fe-2S domain-containing protein [Myxococcales bacterium]|nr:Rieske 2Fe-2S domain-containing protein [Myxococcales bacterium]
MAERDLEWVKVLETGELTEGRVKPVTCHRATVCMTHYQGRFAALDNRCPHQGGPLGEGSIENGWLRCPWHGWDFHPTSGDSPGGHDDGVDSWPVQVREDGVYVGFEVPDAHAATVSDVMARTFTEWGIRWVFGMVGHSNLGLADGLRRQTMVNRLRYVGIRHEGAAAFACSAYGKLTGRPAACLAIAGPGATNLLTGLWDAHVDRSPVLALTGQVDTQVIGRGAFQEVDLKAAFGGVAVFSADVQRDSDHAELAARAVKTAILQDGVSHLVFPDEVQTIPSDARPKGPAGRIVQRTAVPDPAQLQPAIEAIAHARRPCIVVGHGARFAMDQVVALAEALKCPVLTTFKAKGQISDHHPLGCGVLGRSGTPIASWFMNEADLLVVLGASFSNHTGITPKKPIVQVDRDAQALGKHHPVEHAVWGEVGQATERIREAVQSGHAAVDHTAEIAQRWQIWRQEKARRLTEGRGQGVSSVAVFEELARAVPGDAIVCVDVGNNTYSFGRYFEVAGQTVLMSGYLGSIGFALPASLGAWAATQEEGTPWHGRQVVSVSGDGGLGQYLAELTTLVAHDMNVVHVVLNNGELGKISKEQRAGSFDVWQTDLVNPSFAAVAEACGALGIRVDTEADLAASFARALAHEGPALVEIMADVTLI